MVNSIDKSLDENCYDPHEFGVAEDLASEKVLEAFLGPKKNPSPKKIFWTNKRPPNVYCQRACDVLPCTPRPSKVFPLVSGIDSINNAFQILFPDQMPQLIVDKTNTKIQHVKDILPAYYNKSNKNTFIHPLDQGGFYAFIGLLYARGLFVQSMHTYKMLFSETAGHPVYSATLPKRRFLFLCSDMSFDDPEERRQLWRMG